MKKGTYWVYGIIAMIFMYMLYYFKSSDHFAGIIAFVLTVSFFYLADKIFNIGFKKHHYVILLFMAIFGVLLSPIYFFIPGYDKILHFSFPFLGCFLVFYIVNQLNIDFKTKVIFTFTIMITLITFEEIAEFVLDWLFDLNLQGVFKGEQVLFQQTKQVEIVLSRITDTMIDLILGVMGSTIFVLVKLGGKK